jgi:outer membrane protein OmpA-like peptidoglycan-associated protein
MKPVALSALALLAVAAAPLAVSAGQHGNYNKVVTDARGNAITTASGGCVVHLRWEGGQDGLCSSTTDAVVYFAFNSSKLSGEAYAELDALVARLGNREVESASVIGYADKIGNSSYNRALSEKRALRVAKYLQSKGLVSASVAEVRALGDSEPVTQCGEKATRKNIACLAPDRRVEVRVKLK